MEIYLKTIGLLLCSNVFMTFAWYSHLKTLPGKALWIAIITSWGIAFFEYIFMIPANRIGFTSGEMTLAQLKILQEVVTLSVFIPFAVLYMHQPVSWNFLGAAVCLVGAVFFIYHC